MVKRGTKIISLECVSCGIVLSLPQYVWLNSDGKPTCVQCGRGLIRRVKYVST